MASMVVTLATAPTCNLWSSYEKNTAKILCKNQFYLILMSINIKICLLSSNKHYKSFIIYLLLQEPSFFFKN